MRSGLLLGLVIGTLLGGVMMSICLTIPKTIIQPEKPTKELLPYAMRRAL